jgi:hypothetical protein
VTGSRPRYRGWVPNKPVTGDTPTKAAKSPHNSQPNAGGQAKTGKPTRAEEKRARLAAAKAELARQQRAARRRRLWIAAGVLVAVVALVLFGVFAVNHAAQSKKGATAAIPSAPASTATGRDTTPPWHAPANVSAAVAAAGLPMLGEEGTALHIHAHLDVIVNGRPVEVPADIGIDEAARKISPLHTHDTTGVIHVESPTQAQFSLGQFFSEWQVSLAADHLGGLRTDGTNVLKVYVNGKPYQGDPGGIILHAHDEIAVVYGTAAQQQNPPGTYQFGNGL